MSEADLLRAMMLMLEERQCSPRQIVVISLNEEADSFDCTPDDAADALERLLANGYIEGPGLDPEGYFLFRKLTRRGTQFVDAARRPRDWDRLKRQNSAFAASA